MTELLNSTLHFSCNPKSGCFSLRPLDETLPALVNARLQIEIRLKGRPARLLDGAWQVTRSESNPRNPSLLGLLNQLDLQLARNGNGLAVHLTFALSDLFPMLLWKVSLENHGSEPVVLDRIVMLQCPGDK